MTIPRLTKGRGMKGPEPFGCFNTGHAPVIIRSRASGKYIVGPELAAYAARDAHLFRTKKRKFGEGRDAAWVYKTRKPAVAKFDEMCAATTRCMRNICRPRRTPLRPTRKRRFAGRPLWRTSEP